MLIVAMCAQASEETPEYIELAEVVRASELIVVVHDEDPAQVRKTLKVKGTREKFGYIEHHLVVEQVLYDKAGSTRPGHRLAVAQGDLQIQYGGHVSYYVDGISESPIIPSYNSPLFRHKLVENSYIAMIAPCTAGELRTDCFTVVGAIESVRNQGQIEDVLHPRTEREKLLDVLRAQGEPNPSPVPLSLQPSAGELAHQLQVQSLFRENFSPPVSAPSGLACVVSFQTAATGAITSFQLQESSGHPGFDAACLKAAADVGALPVPEAEFAARYADGYKIRLKAPKAP